MSSIEIREARASEIEVGDIVTEIGLDAVKIAEVRMWGDTVLVRTAGDVETSFDRDTVVLVERVS